MLTKEEAPVTLSVFGTGRYRSKVTERGAPLAGILGEHGVAAGEHRVAVNGHTASAEAIVRQGDQLTVVPRIQGG